ncbi:response regulator [Kordiimonas pumila]|uniref:Two-component system response regulator n=1 Tax=Kordiimonas pumila TaxID=2161677 RepID=A0ABV7D355_9PROT|nr:response regulator [Kordiimonas pumila]
MSILENKKILAIDDTKAIRTFLRISLMDKGVDFYEAATAAEGAALCQQKNPHVVMLDLGLPDRDGLDLLPELKAGISKTSPVIIVLTVRNDRRVRDLAFARGADAYVTKPFVMEDLVDTIEQAL